MQILYPFLCIKWQSVLIYLRGRSTKFWTLYIGILYGALPRIFVGPPHVSCIPVPFFIVKVKSKCLLWERLNIHANKTYLVDLRERLSTLICELEKTIYIYWRDKPEKANLRGCSCDSASRVHKVVRDRSKKRNVDIEAAQAEMSWLSESRMGQAPKTLKPTNPIMHLDSIFH